jgi:hypothetical protein
MHQWGPRRIDLVERKLVEEMLSPEGVSLLERRVREHVRNASQAPRKAPKPIETQVARKRQKSNSCAPS